MRRSRRWVLGTGVVALAMTMAVFSARRVAAQQPPGAAVEGTVRVQHPPVTEPLVANVDNAVCGHAVANDQVVVGPGGVLAGAVVWLDGVRAQAAAHRDVTVALDQQHCRFAPHVLSATVGATLALTSRDPVLHNIHAVMDDRTLFNVAIPVAGVVVRKPLREAGLVRVKCDVHGWMSAFVYVFEHGFHAVTGRDGTFHIGDVPAGTYPVHVWHERLGERTASVRVGASGSATVDVTY
jgi:plastocyanin